MFGKIKKLKKLVLLVHLGIYRMSAINESFLQCPYCTKHESGHNIRVPRSVGKYRIKIIYDNFLILNCSRCGRNIRVVIGSKTLRWDKMQKKVQEEIKKIQYNKYKGGNKQLQ